MIPEEVHDLPSMKDMLVERGTTVVDEYKCPSCPRICNDLVCTDVLPMIEVNGEIVKLHRFCCTVCASTAHRIGLAAQKEAALAQLDPWDTELGTFTKLERDRIVNSSFWTDAPGSPLSAECQLNWTEWRAKMHRLTLDFANPGDVVFPEQPALVYGD